MLVDAASAWAVLQRARQLHAITARSVLVVKNDEPALMGLAGCNAYYWLAFEGVEYISKQKVIRCTKNVRFAPEPDEERTSIVFNID